MGRRRGFEASRQFEEWLTHSPKAYEGRDCASHSEAAGKAHLVEGRCIHALDRSNRSKREMNH